jgi:energy-coupling factor transport system permease protein
MTGGLDPRAALAWLAGAAAVIFAFDNPWLHLLLSVIALAIARAWAEPQQGGIAAGLVGFAIGVTVLRTALFALTGHAGTTVLVRLPVLQLPPVFGGTTLGGPVTAEAVTSGVVEGLKLVAVVASFGAFLAVTETIDVVRLLPRVLFEAGLIVSIAMAFIPQLARTAGDVRDAARMRGERRRFAVSALVMPLLATALERSIMLAESLDARGYGRTSAPPGEAGWRAAAAGSGLLALITGALWALGTFPRVTGLVAALALAALVASLARLSKAVARTVYRRRRFRRGDAVVAATGVAVLLASLVLAGTGLAATPSPYAPDGGRHLPAPEPAAAVVVAILVLPAALPRPRPA